MFKHNTQQHTHTHTGETDLDLVLIDVLVTGRRLWATVLLLPILQLCGKTAPSVCFFSTTYSTVNPTENFPCLCALFKFTLQPSEPHKINRNNEDHFAASVVA